MGNEKTTTDLHRLFAGCLEQLGGREFILKWARSNPSDFMQVLASLQISSADKAPESPKQAALALQEVKASPVESTVERVGAYNRQAAAEYLSISTRFLDDLLARGAMRKVKIGRKTLVRKIDLDAYLAKLAEEVGN